MQNEILKRALRAFRAHMKDKGVTFLGGSNPLGLMKAWSELDSSEREVYFLEAAGIVKKDLARDSPLVPFLKKCKVDEGDDRDAYVPTERPEDSSSEAYTSTETTQIINGTKTDASRKMVETDPGSPGFKLYPEDLEWLERPEVSAMLMDQKAFTSAPAEVKEAMKVDRNLAHDHVSVLQKGCSKGQFRDDVEWAKEILARAGLTPDAVQDKDSKRDKGKSSNVSASLLDQSTGNSSVAPETGRSVAESDLPEEDFLAQAGITNRSSDQGRHHKMRRVEVDPFMERIVSKGNGKKGKNKQISMTLRETENGIPSPEEIISMAKRYPEGEAFLKSPSQLKGISNGFQISSVDGDVKVNVYARTVVIAGSAPQKGVRLIEK